MILTYFEKTFGEKPWPYKVDYEKQTQVTCDVLVVGGGLGGCFAAIQAAKHGAKVAVIEKGNTKRSGSAGAGIDHWGMVLTNPCSTQTPEEAIAQASNGDPFGALHALYISMKESYDAALDLEEYGVEIRDTAEEFLDAPFRDPDTKFIFSDDYDNPGVLRIHGKDLKPALQKEMKRLKIQMFDRTMATALLTEGGKVGGTVVGATGFHLRTGEWFTFNAKATVLATAKPLRLWEFATDLVGSNAAHDDPNCAGDGDVMAYRAGAKLTMMERTSPTTGGKRYPAYGTGNAHNTWFPCSIMDATGKYIPWVDCNDNEITDPARRNFPAPGQKRFSGAPGPQPKDVRPPCIIPDLSERIRTGEYKLPFFADLGDLPDYERRGIFGLMLGNEGKTYIPIVKNLSNAGFDPKVDMLQANVLPIDSAGIFGPWWDCKSPLAGPNVRDASFGAYGGVMVDWDMKSTLEGLFAVGNQAAGGMCAATAAATGRYCGRVVGEYVKTRDLIPVEEPQVEEERRRVYAPLDNTGRYGWKEVQLGLCRMMQDYCGDVKSKDILEMGLWWLNSIRNHELTHCPAHNPHDLGKILECEVRLSVGEIIMLQSLHREASSPPLDFFRSDFPQIDIGKGLITLRMEEDGAPVREEMPFRYWLKDSEDYQENYNKHCCLKEGER